MSKIRERKAKPTKAESKLAFDSQAPYEGEDNPIDSPAFKRPSKEVAKKGAFSALQDRPTTDGSLLFGNDQSQWINPMEDRNPLFPNGGDVSIPFFVLRAFQYESVKAQTKSRIGIKLVSADENIWHVSFPLRYDEEGYSVYEDRDTLLEHFETSSSPIGLLQFQKVDRGFQSGYWRLIAADEHTIELARIQQSAPQVDIEVMP